MPAPTTLPLSVSIVCQNNKATIEHVVRSVGGLAAEVVALDSGSSDGTREILASLGARVIDQPWLGFVRQKQAALERCTMPWVLHLDSDESVEPPLASAIRAALERDDPRIAGYQVNRRVWYAGRFLNHAWQPEWRLRLVRRDRARWGGLDPHDAMEILPTSPGAAAVEVRRLPGDLRHDSIPSLAQFLAKQAAHARVAAQSQHERGRRGSVARLTFAPPAEFLKQILVRGAWRDGWRGWAAASASSVAVAMKHAILLELSRAPRDAQAQAPSPTPGAGP